MALLSSVLWPLWAPVPGPWSWRPQPAHRWLQSLPAAGVAGRPILLHRLGAPRGAERGLVGAWCARGSAGWLLGAPPGWHLWELTAHVGGQGAGRLWGSRSSRGQHGVTDGDAGGDLSEGAQVPPCSHLCSHTCIHACAQPHNVHAHAHLCVCIRSTSQLGARCSVDCVGPWQPTVWTVL